MEFKHMALNAIPIKHRQDHEGYEFYRRKFVPYGGAKNTQVCVYEIPPGKAAYPYHYHHKNEETFYILSGEGVLKTPQGERKVRAGEFLFFPTGPEGAHKLTNCSASENLIYIDFDVVHDLDVCVYPDSDKIGIWGMGINRIYPQSSNVDYYEGE